MAFKFVILACLLAAANAGLIAAPAAVAYSAAPAVSHVSYSSPVVSYGLPHASVAVATPALTSQSSNILRSYGNLGQIAHQSKTITTPFSSVSKSDVRVSNPGLRIAAHTPAIATYAAAPSYSSYVAPASHGLLGVAYSAAPAVSHVSYAAPSVSHVSYAAPSIAHIAAPAIRSSIAYAPTHGSYAVHDPAVGVTHESTLRSLGGNSAVTHHSKAVDSAFSSVRKSDTRVTNDAIRVASYATPVAAIGAYAAPALSVAATPVVAHTSFQGIGAHYVY